MDPIRSMLIVLAKHAEEARLDWQAGRAAVRARGEIPGRTDAFARYHQANLCLIAAIDAADLPAGFRVYDITLSRDPLAAAQQLRETVVTHDRHGPIEAAHEAARLAYKATFAEPINDQEQQYVDILADLPAARRDKIADLAEERAQSRKA